MDSEERQKASPTLKDQIQGWLASWDFTDNPFGTWEAAREPSLKHYFVKRSSYEHLRTSHSSALIFAARGQGKSALRIMIQSECRPEQPTSPFFAVPMIKFSPLIEKYSQRQVCTLTDYLPRIFDASIANLINAASDLLLSDVSIPKASLGELRYWIEKQASQFTKPHYLAHLLEDQMPGTGKEVLQDWIAAVSEGRLPSGNRKIVSIASLWLQVFKVQALPPPMLLDSPISTIDAFVAFVVDLLSCGSTPCRVMYLLVDGIDEYDLTQNDPKISAGILRPLLGNVRFLEIPHLAVKFFLPTEQRSELEGLARLDRLEGEVHTLTWDWSTKGEFSVDDLRALLRRRIRAFNEVGMQTLDELCAPDLRHWIEDALLQECRNSPRNLLRLGNLLFVEHCREQPQPGSEIQRAEWERAVERFRATLAREEVTLDASTEQQYISEDKPPLLYIDLEADRVFKGGKELNEPLSDREYRFLAHLYRHKGKVCSRDDIRWHVFTNESDNDKTRRIASDAVTDTGINSVVYRLRKKLGEENDSYIKTITGRGFLLENAA